MNLQLKLVEDLKSAMKARDTLRVDTLRLLRSQLKDAEIDKGASLTETDEIAVLSNAAKKRKEAIAIYQKSERKDLLARETAELQIITSYLPRQLSEAEITAAITAVIAETGATSRADMGKVMGVVMKQLQGQVDGKRVQQIVQSKLELDH